MQKFFFFFILLYSFHLFANETYEVFFNGISDPSVIQLLRSSSQLIALEKNPPSTAAALRKRAEADIPRFEKALQSLAFYDSQINLHIQIETSPIQIIFDIQTGEIFTFSSFQILSEKEIDQPLCEWIQPEVLNIVMDAPAYPKIILHAEEILLLEMSTYGYPLASLKHRKVEVDLLNKTVSVVLTLDSGPLSYFGDITISGTKKVSKAFFQKKIAWKKGQLYTPCLIEETFQNLEASSLFSSIDISHADNVEETGLLPIDIDVTEAKHRSLGFGAGYSTLRSFGIVGEYENRNERHRGERFALRASAWNNLFDGTLVYVIPDWYQRRQDLIWLAQAHHEITEGYTESFLSASIGIERQVSKRLRTSTGLMFKHLRNERSDNNGLFNLIKIPMGARWIDVDNFIDPTHGYSFSIKTVPTFEVLNDPFAYVINTFNASFYQPLDSCKNMIATAKITLGSIFGSGRREIPPSERLYAGSEETLRGYKYLTVSPLDCDDDPLGGRSMMILSLEVSRKINEQWGAVLFYDIGNVYEDPFPSLQYKQLQSVGFGIRYHTPVGPLRLDFAFPLNRRPIDHFFELYLSLGQTF